MNWIAAFLVLLTASVSAGAADCAPQRTVKMVVVNSSPGISADSFGAKPKTIYRLGTRFARIEEVPDPERKIHALIVIAEPDSWLANRADGTGRHIYDKDPKGVVRAPLFTQDYGQLFPALFRRLEFGCEAAFFARFHSPIDPLSRSNPPVFKQAVGINGWTLVLMRSTRSGPPTALFLFHGDDVVSVIRYVSYEELNRADTGLFAKPPGIAFVEATGQEHK